MITPTPKILPIPPKTRMLMLAVHDGDDRVTPILWQMASLERLDEVLSWLVDNRLTGRQFYAWLEEWRVKMKLRKNRPVPLEKPICFILQKINREREMKPLFVGKDGKWR